MALAARELGIRAHIVMGRNTPEIKIAAVRKLGARILLHGDAYDEAYAHAIKLAEKKNLNFIHPFDDPDVIAGQGTVGVEILRQHQEPVHSVFVPVGGGGLIAGVAAYIKSICPNTKIIGVEPEDSPTLERALKAKRRVILKQTGLFADGVAVKQIGKETFRLARKTVDEVVLVKTDEICAAIKDVFEDTRSIAEPAGALAVAGMKKYIHENGIRDEHMIAIVSGANMNFDRLRHVAERAEIGEMREALLAVQIPEVPGSFQKFCKLLGKRSITEFNYRYADSLNAYVFCGIEVPEGFAERERVIAMLTESGYEVTDLTDNETAKLHIRYMVGGHTPEATNEQLFRFQFPERPGALLEFLTKVGKRWNISLFHYRNHGAAYGRVLIGIQLPERDKQDFISQMDALGYRYWEETNNPAYHFFASPAKR